MPARGEAALTAAGEVRPTGRWLGFLARSLELFPALAAIALFLFWAVANAGILPTDSYPGAIGLLGLLGVTTFAYRDRLPALPPLAIAAVALLAAFTLWSFVSITWADDQGAAWDGANRALLYLTAFALFAIPPWRAVSAAMVLGLYALGIAVIGAVVMIAAAQSSNPFDYLVANRFAEPTGYHNANAALFTAAMFPAVFLASRRETPWFARGLMLAAAGVLFQLALLPQSRGWLIAAPIAVVAYIVLVPGRARSLIVLGVLAAVLATTAGPILDVFDSVGDSRQLMGALDDARQAMLVAGTLLFAVGTLIGLADSRLELSDRVRTFGSRAVGGIAAIAAVAGAIVAIGLIGNPVSWASDRWQDFKGGEFEHDYGGSRLGQGLGSNRYDFWRVAADGFTGSPIGGVGSNNFAEDYVRDRESEEEPAYSHNLPLSILSETGLVGAGFFGGFLFATLIAVGRVRLRSDDPLARGVAGLVAVVFVYWFLHSTGDWFWALPGLSAPIFAWLGLATGIGAERDPRRPGSRPWERPAAAIAVVAGLLAFLSLALPWTAAVDVKKAGEIWGADPVAAFDRLDRADSLNFLSANPDLVEGAIASRLGERRRMRAAFEQALDRDPRNWYATLELAALDAVEGNAQASLDRLDRVAELNPREPVTDEIRRGVLKGRPVTLEELDDIFLERYCRVHGQELGPDGCVTP
jgi:O-antigen ligase